MPAQLRHIMILQRFFYYHKKNHNHTIIAGFLILYEPLGFRILSGAHIRLF